METCRRLAREEGMFAGFSSGANVCAALKLLHTRELAGKTIFVCLCDSGMVLIYILLMSRYEVSFN